ncbi:MAG TPA: hypothetical protein VHS96_00445 [Bacteroidia bacterium]|nr:hypothetical protein [Bacteroidia bacterium]
MTPFISQLHAGLLQDASDANLRQWGAHIVENDLALADLLALIHAEKKVATRFSWMLGGIVERDPQRLRPVIPYLFTRRKEILILNFERSLAKFFALAGIPSEIEGEAVEALFQWLMDPKVLLSTRIFAMAALDRYCVQQPELRNELRLVLERIASDNGGSLEKKAMGILGKGKG